MKTKIERVFEFIIERMFCKIYWK